MSSSLIGLLRCHCGNTDLLCPPTQLPELVSLWQALDRLPDPRRAQGCRYRLDSLLALCLLAVLGGGHHALPH
ncbi:transposase family protein [Streptomyces sp. TRM76130]|nr:transposase family protein [Streptomyces sp. TRM76130]